MIMHITSIFRSNEDFGDKIHPIYTNIHELQHTNIYE